MMLSDEMEKRQNMCMGGPCHWEKLPGADGINFEIYVRRGGLVHRYERKVVNMGDYIVRYYHQGSTPDVDPNGETKLKLGAVK